MAKVNEKRRLWKYIVFGALTFGIYDIYFDYCMIGDLNTVCGAVENDNEDRASYLWISLPLILSLISIVLTIVATVFAQTGSEEGLLSALTLLGVMGFILPLLVLIFAIYELYWIYKQGNRMKRAGYVYNTQVEENGSTYLLWSLLGLLLFGIGPYIARYIFIHNLNKLSTAYNARAAGDASPEWGPGSGPKGRIIDDPPTVSSLYGTVTCIQGQYKGMEIKLEEKDQLIIGRNSQKSQLILNDPDISRMHCTIRFSPAPDNRYYVTDHSSVGTYLNGSIRLPQGVSTPCPIGSRLTLGNGNNVFILG